MNAEEALKVVRMARGAFPSTPFDEYTPDAWALALEDERLADAIAAIKAIMREETFIHVSDIVQRIRRIRNERILEYGLLPTPPAELADDPEAEMVWRRDVIRRIADGEQVPKPLELTEPSPEHSAKLAKVIRTGLRSVPPGQASA